MIITARFGPEPTQDRPPGRDICWARAAYVILKKTRSFSQLPASLTGRAQCTGGGGAGADRDQ